MAKLTHPFLLLENLRAYKEKSGPLGPSSLQQLLDCAVVETLVNRPMSKLRDLWAMGIISDWAKNLSKPVPPYVASDVSKRGVLSTYLPGGKRNECKEKMVSLINVLHLSGRPNVLFEK